MAKVEITSEIVRRFYKSLKNHCYTGDGRYDLTDLWHALDEFLNETPEPEITVTKEMIEVGYTLWHAANNNSVAESLTNIYRAMRKLESPLQEPICGPIRQTVYSDDGRNASGTVLKNSGWYHCRNDDLLRWTPHRRRDDPK